MAGPVFGDISVKGHQKVYLGMRSKLFACWRINVPIMSHLNIVNQEVNLVVHFLRTSQGVYCIGFE